MGDWAFPAQWVGQVVGQSRGPLSTVQRIRIRILWYVFQHTILSIDIWIRGTRGVSNWQLRCVKQRDSQTCEIHIWCVLFDVSQLTKFAKSVHQIKSPTYRHFGSVANVQIFFLKISLFETLIQLQKNVIRHFNCKSNFWMNVLEKELITRISQQIRHFILTCSAVTEYISTFISIYLCVGEILFGNF